MRRNSKIIDYSVNMEGLFTYRGRGIRYGTVKYGNYTLYIHYRILEILRINDLIGKYSVNELLFELCIIAVFYSSIPYPPSTVCE